ncbi:hypothetical protein D9M68_718380 [compost metagenome]
MKTSAGHARQGFGGDRIDGAVAHPNGVVDQDVEVTEAALEVFDGVLESGALGHVARVGLGLCALVAQRLGRALCVVALDVEHTDGGALGREAFADGAPDALCAASDKGHLALQS